jgi:hypothetical protein
MEIERRAQSEWRRQEELLNEKLEQANERLRQLQRGDQEARILDAAFVAEIEKLREERAQTRQELRNVRRKLREDVERLGATIKFINIAAIPMLVIALSIVIAVLNRLRRKVES